MSKEKIEIEKRNSVIMYFDDCPWHKEDDFMVVTEWRGGDGWDICISDRHLSLHRTEYDALKKIIKKLGYE